MNTVNCVNSTTNTVYICRTEKQPDISHTAEKVMNDALKIYNLNPKDCRFLI